MHLNLGTGAVHLFIATSQPSFLVALVFVASSLFFALSPLLQSTIRVSSRASYLASYQTSAFYTPSPSASNNRRLARITASPTASN
ncbi:hypothetical protein C8J56DRAFT_1066483 [Mycena floridula]|nr:hypothetical protein C8J56DRAFT_1066451 [Mycena floridula]KAJ7573354.1 hypothetical protein C8J56DRAFT_1066483 [Mycena floridula]